MLTGLWMTPFLLHRIGQHDYGLWLVGLQVLTYLTLIDFGVVALLPRETAYATGRGGGIESATDLPHIVGQTSLIVLWQTPIVAVAAAGVYIFMPAQWENLRLPLAWMLAGFVLTFPLRVFHAVLQGLQDLTFLGAITLISWAVNTALTIVLVFRGFGLSALAIGWIAGQTLASAIYFCRLKLRFPTVLPSRLPSSGWQSIRTQLTSGFWVSVAQMAQLLVTATDMLILGKVLGPAAVVPYACTGKIISVLANQPQMLMQAAAPGLCEMTTGETRGRMLSALTSLTQLMLMASAAIFSVVILVNPGFVQWWVGPNLYGGTALNLTLLAAMFFRHFNTPYAFAVLFLGHERRLSLTNLSDGAVTVVTAVLLTHAIGTIGAPLGSLAGVCLVSIPRNFRLLARETNVSFGEILWPLWPLLARTTGLWVVLLLLSTVWVPHGFQLVAAASVAVAVIYSALILPLVFRPPIRGYLAAALPPVIARRFALAEG